MFKQWILNERAAGEEGEELGGYPELIRRLLRGRGIKNKQEAEKFLCPDYEKDLHDPYLMADMGKAVERIVQAIKNNEKVVIFGDYDADGICAGVVFHDFFKKVGFENFHVHIPDRFLDGYGLSNEAVEEFVKVGAKLIITLDCGIVNVEEVELASKSGVDVIIIDHHIVPQKIPAASAVVNPKREDDGYPFKFLCGAGVAFKTVCALIKSKNFNIVPGWEKWLLDVVALATVADMVSLTGESRAIVFYGLKVLAKTQRPGLLSFYRRLDIRPPNISEDDLAFLISPRINVAGRMEHATIGFDLLTTLSAPEADWISDRLEIMTSDRKKIVGDVIDQIDRAINSSGGKKPEVIVEGDKSWYPGVLGLAANKVMEKYGCPVFLWGQGKARAIRGSCRSDGSLNLVEFMGKLPKEFFDDYGGHALSGGFSMKGENTAGLKEAIINLYREFPKQETNNGFVLIDGEMTIDEINPEIFSLVDKLRPFGIDNPKPVFSLRNVEIAGIRKFGNGGIHLQLDFRKNKGKIVSAVGFFMAGKYDFYLKTGQKIDLAASLDKNYFRGREELRLRIIDIKIKQYG